VERPQGPVLLFGQAANETAYASRVSTADSLFDPLGFVASGVFKGRRARHLPRAPPF